MCGNLNGVERKHSEAVERDSAGSFKSLSAIEIRVIIWTVMFLCCGMIKKQNKNMADGWYEKVFSRFFVVATWIHLKLWIYYLQEIKESGASKKCWAGRKPQIAAARVTWAGLIMPTSTLLMTSACSIYFVQNMYIVCTGYDLCTEYLAHDFGLLYALCT